MSDKAPVEKKKPIITQALATERIRQEVERSGMTTASWLLTILLRDFNTTSCRPYPCSTSTMLRWIEDAVTSKVIGVIAFIWDNQPKRELNVRYVPTSLVWVKCPEVNNPDAEVLSYNKKRELKLPIGMLRNNEAERLFVSRMSTPNGIDDSVKLTYVVITLSACLDNETTATVETFMLPVPADKDCRLCRPTNGKDSSDREKIITYDVFLNREAITIAGTTSKILGAITDDIAGYHITVHAAVRVNLRHFSAIGNISPMIESKSLLNTKPDPTTKQIITRVDAIGYFLDVKSSV